MSSIPGPLTTHCIEKLIYFKPAEAQSSSWLGVESRVASPHLTMDQNYEVRRQFLGHRLELVAGIVSVESMDSSSGPLKIQHVEGLMLVKSVETQISQVCVMWKFEEWRLAQVSRSSLHHGSKLR
ncbi:hypothetical protein TNCV_4969031 [Trichonephila clavipes]|nr:hypothetical protein TNCV_4969031 [Trichonephila clavipes]